MEDPDQDPPGRYPPASCSLIGVQPLFSQFSDMCPFHLRVCSVPGKFCLQLLPAWLPSPGPSGLSLNVERRQLTAVSETGQPTPYFFLLLPFLFLYSRSHNLSSCVSLSLRPSPPLPRIATDSTIFVVVTSSPGPGWIDMWTQSISTWVPVSETVVPRVAESASPGNWWKCQFSGPTHDLLNQKLWGWGSAV